MPTLTRYTGNPVIPIHSPTQRIAIELAAERDAASGELRGIYTVCTGVPPNVVPELHEVASRDGLRFLVDANNRAVVGGVNAAAGWPYPANCASFHRVNGVDHCFFVNGYVNGNLWHAIRPQEQGWSILPGGPVIPWNHDGAHGVYNSDFVIDENGIWWMAVEFIDAPLTQPNATYRMKMFKSLDGGNTFQQVSGYLESLRFGAGCYGGPRIKKVGSLWMILYHASTGTDSINPNFPTFIAKAASADLINWTRDANPLLQVTDEVIWGIPADQLADPELIDYGDYCEIIYEDANNNLATLAMLSGRINVAIWDGTLAELAAYAPPAPPVGAVVIDNGSPGFSVSGSQWLSYVNGHLNDHHYAPTGSGDQIATWQFGVPPGQYKVYAAWPTHENRATNAPFRIYDGATLLDTVRVNQELAPADETINGSGFKLLGTFAIATSLTVTLANDADEWIIADAIAAVQD